jgi:hypothetical protein
VIISGQFSIKFRGFLHEGRGVDSKLSQGELLAAQKGKILFLKVKNNAET